MRRFAVCLLFVLAAVVDARATDPLSPPDIGRFLRWGPVRVRPGFAIPALGYDDNVYSSSESSSSEGAYLIRLSPRIEGLVLFGDAAFLTFKERLDYTAYPGLSTLNYFENQGSARLTVPFRRIGAYADFALNRLKDPPASEIDSRPVRREKRLGAGLLFRIGWRMDADVSVVRSDWTNQDPDYISDEGFTIEELLNRTERGWQSKLRYRASGITRLTLDVSRRDIVFDDPDVRRDTTQSSVMPGLEFSSGGPLAGTVRIGSVRLDAKAEEVPDYSGPVGDAALVWRISQATSARLEGGRRVGFAIYQTNRYFQSDFEEIRGVHYLTRIVGVEIGGGRERLEFPGSVDLDPRVDRVRRLSAGVRLRLPESVLGRAAEYTVGISRRRRDSSDDTLDLSRTVFAFGASLGF